MEDSEEFRGLLSEPLTPVSAGIEPGSYLYLSTLAATGFRIPRVVRIG